jgi:hypothetical protein
MASPPLAVPYNWPDTGHCSRTRKRADVWQVSLCRRTIGTAGTEGQVRHLMVNGPEDSPRLDLDAVDWDWIDWRSAEREVRRLRQRIFKASQEGDLANVRSLQKLMLRSRSNTLLSVRQVTQRNAGRKTAGIDGEVALTSEARAEVAVRVHQSISSWEPRAVRRVYIPKASDKTKLRPLGIPVILDRCHQARVRNALEPEWEARFEPKVRHRVPASSLVRLADRMADWCLCWSGGGCPGGYGGVGVMSAAACRVQVTAGFLVSGAWGLVRPRSCSGSR